jgi:hypothetical protein
MRDAWKRRDPQTILEQAYKKESNYRFCQSWRHNQLERKKAALIGSDIRDEIADSACLFRIVIDV